MPTSLRRLGTLMKLASISSRLRRGGALGAFLCALVLALPVARAQFQAPGISTGLLRVFAEFNGFASQGELRMLDGAGVETMNFAVHLGHEPQKLRLDFDLAQVKGGLLPEFALESLSRVGLNRVATVLDAEKKTILMLYPLARAYTEMEMPKEEVAAAQRKYTSSRTESGRESIDGHPCVKTVVTFTDDAGQKSEATYWLTPDFPGLPAQVETRDKQGTLQLRFKWVRPVTTGAKRFAVPTGYQKYASSTALVKAVVDQAVAAEAKDAAENPEKPEKPGKAGQPDKK